MSGLRLPRLLSDGAVLQRRKSIHIWGWDDKGSVVSVELRGEEDGVIGCATAECDDNGRFDVYLPAHESGGPYDLMVSDDKGQRVVASDIMIGLVWFCSGQSNMELPITRVKDKYPRMLDVEPNDRIRTFKIVEETCYKGSYEEHNTGDWKSVSQDTIMNFSATGYFFAENLQRLTGQTVGFINASLGGSRIWSWMSREMLEGYDELLALADQYADDDFVKGQIEYNIREGNAWREALYKADLGFKEGWDKWGNWEQFSASESEWGDFEVPNFFEGTALDGFIGSVWFVRKFDLPAELAGKSARLFLGTMVDNDVVFVNGQKVGETGYQYPPRKYDIPEGLTREKDNIIVIRLCVESGLGRFTPDKEYKIFNEKSEVRLDGTWKYRIAARCDKMPEMDFINWKPTGLYNAMTAPCHNYPVDGVVWYQGESNVEDGYDYNELTERMVSGYRKAWGDESLPFIGVQLPNFVIDQRPRIDDWGKFRLTQKKLLDIPGTGMVVTMGLGEDNDLHPVTKEPIGERLVLWAAHLKYGYSSEFTGPVAENVSGITDENGNMAALITLSHAGGLSVLDAGKGTELEDFYIVDDAGCQYKAKATLDVEKSSITVVFDEDELGDEDQAALWQHASKVLWCGENTYHGGLVTNETGIPMGPFKMPITERV